MITIGNNLYISGLLNLWKTDQDLNVLIQYNDPTISYYRGICNTTADNLIYVASTFKKSIDLFDLDLKLVKRILIPYIPYSISAFNNQMYVGCEQGVIILLQNQRIINSFIGCNTDTSFVKSILFDQSGYMAMSCLNSPQLYLYKNLIYTGKSFLTKNKPVSFIYDAKDRFIVSSESQIDIYSTCLATDEEIIAMTIFKEAYPNGYDAVAYVIYNRIQKQGFKKSGREICLENGQFEVWKSQWKNNIVRCIDIKIETSGKGNFARCLGLANNIQSKKPPVPVDPTNGCLYFLKTSEKVKKNHPGGIDIAGNWFFKNW
jgi:hypothetical protein